MVNPRVEATYARAMAAFQEGSFDVARRLIGEILIDDPGHAGARALKTRVEARMSSAASGRPGQTPAPGAFRSTSAGRGNIPEATSVDPTILIDRASSSFQPPEYIEPTVVVRREDLESHVAPARQMAPPPPMPPPGRPARSAAPAPEPTVLIPPKKRTVTADSPSPGGFLGPFWQRITGAGAPAPRRSSTAGRRTATGFWTPTTRGAAMVLGGLVVASLLVVGVIALVRWVWPGGYILTITKPVGGTITGDRLQCDTRGSDCTTTPSTETVELQTVADSGYVFTGFTGDCAPSGRVAMTQPRTCGARFEPIGSSIPTPVTWPLTILKPTGGTIVGASGLICGVLGSNCSVTLPDGEAVTLTVEAATGFEFLQFTGDCNAKDGTTTMTSARTCSATFAPAANPRAADIPRPQIDRPRVPVRAGADPIAPRTPSTTPPAIASGQPLPSAQGSGSGGGSAPSPGPTPGTPAGPPGSGTAPAPAGPTGLATGPAGAGTEKPPEAAITPEAHARREIEQLVKSYCGAMETLQPDQLKKFYPQVDVALHRELFRQYKSLKCTLAGPPEYDRLDASPAGGAQVKVGIKQQIEMKSGGAPKVLETIATIVVSRMSNQSPWLIDRLKVEQKPK
jgi:hypothetical protein